MPTPQLSSARNQFSGKIASITTGLVNTEVALDIGQGSKISAIITNESAKILDLKLGDSATALFKASWVILSTNTKLKTSARNQFLGKIKTATPGAVNAEIIIETPAGQIAAIVTNESYKELGLKPETEVLALIKSSHVIIGVA